MKLWMSRHYMQNLVWSNRESRILETIVLICFTHFIIKYLQIHYVLVIRLI